MSASSSKETRYRQLSQVDALASAWRRVRRKAGLDSLVIDPVENVDYELSLKRNLGLLARRLTLKSYRPSGTDDLPTTKNAGLTRPVVVLDLEDAIVSQALVNMLAKPMDRQLLDGVFSMRATGKERNPFRGWYQDWPKYQKKLQNSLPSGSWLVVSDITGYFDNIDLRILKEQLLQLGNVDTETIDLTLFLLDSWMFRQLYGMPIGRGIPQADIDFPQALSNFFLYPHDEQMEQQYPGAWFRWMDDINVVVDSEVEGKRAIRVFERSLKRMFLTPNASKTKILSPKKIPQHFFFDENDYLTKFSGRLKKRLKAEDDVEELESELIEQFTLFSAGERIGNWEKVLKRYYTAFKNLNSGFLIDRVSADLLSTPSMDQKIREYLVGIDFQPRTVDLVLDYLNDDHNLYPSTEIQLLSLLLELRLPSSTETSGIVVLARDLLFGKRAQHWYSRCLATLLLAKHSTMSDVRKMAKFLANSGDELGQGYLRRYLLSTSCLLPPGDSDMVKAIDYAKGQDDPGLSRLVYFVEVIGSGAAPLPSVVKQRLRVTEAHAPFRRYLAMRIYIVLRMACWNAQFHGDLRGIVQKLSSLNEDPVMDDKLSSLISEIS